MSGFGVLEGVRVLDLTQMLSGPFATMLLADHGADVVKIESPTGDMTRPAGPFHDDDEQKTHGGYFSSVNRNKKSVVLDLKSDIGKQAFVKMVETADVVVENYRSGVMDRLGLGYEVLREANPRLVYGCLNGFGDPRSGRSPYNHWPAFDVVAQAMGGIMGITGPDPDTPTKIGPGVGDIIPGIMLAFGIVSALLHVRKTGKGQFLDIAMTDAVLAACERIVYQHSISGLNPGPEGNHHPVMCPFGMFPARDGFVTIATPSDEFFTVLCEALDCPGLTEDPRFDCRPNRTANKVELIAELSAVTRQFTKSELDERLGGKIPFGPVMRVNEIVADEHFAVRDMLVDLDAPGSSKRTTVVGVPIKFQDTPGKIVRRGPYLGEDTEIELRRSGISEELIEKMIADQTGSS